MTANIEDVARHAQVSIATVSRTFKHPELVADTTRARVLAAANQLDFSISRSASVFQTGQAFRVALLVNDAPSAWFNAHVYEGLDSVLHSAGYDIVFYHIGDSSERHEFFKNLPIRRNVDAVVVTSFDIDHAEIARLKSMNVPVAGINALPQKAFGISVSVDDEHAMHLMTRHLTALGHRNIAFITFRQTSKGNATLHFSANLRAKGFNDACIEADAKPSVIEVNDGPQSIDECLTQLSALEKMPTAICCVQDSIAVPLMSRLREFGYSVPEDISVTGFDDIDLSAQVGLTTVHQDPGMMGNVVAKLLLKAINVKGINPTHETLPPQLIFRSSSAPLRRGSALRAH